MKKKHAHTQKPSRKPRAFSLANTCAKLLDTCECRESARGIRRCCAVKRQGFANCQANYLIKPLFFFFFFFILNKTGKIEILMKKRNQVLVVYTLFWCDWPAFAPRKPVEFQIWQLLHHQSGIITLKYSHLPLIYIYY